MNIFILDNEPTTAAHLHCDKHVVKMILEAAQMLSTTHRMLDGTEVIGRSPTGRKQKQYILADSLKSLLLYKAVHMNHPCTVWTRKSLQNYNWHYELFTALCDEYTYRYGKVHETDRKLRELLAEPPKNIDDIGLTPFPQCMPDYCKNADTIAAYRSYYLNEKKDFARWTKRSQPNWFH